MATLLDRVREGRLAKLEPVLSWRQQEARLIYVSPRAQDWMTNKLIDEVSDRILETSPLEQLDEFINTYCAGGQLTFERQFRPIRHISDGIWELKTPDVRLFGWFAARDVFVCSAGDTKYRVKKYNLVAGYRDEAVRARLNLNLNEPSFVAGEDPHAVISAFCLPPS